MTTGPLTVSELHLLRGLAATLADDPLSGLPQETRDSLRKLIMLAVRLAPPSPQHPPAAMRRHMAATGYLTSAEVAVRADQPLATVRDAIHSNNLPATEYRHRWYIAPADADRYVAAVREHRRAARAPAA